MWCSVFIRRKNLISKQILEGGDFLERSSTYYERLSLLLSGFALLKSDFLTLQSEPFPLQATASYFRFSVILLIGKELPGARIISKENNTCSGLSGPVPSCDHLLKISPITFQKCVASQNFAGKFFVPVTHCLEQCPAK